MKEMTIRGLLAHNPAIGVSVRATPLSGARQHSDETGNYRASCRCRPAGQFEKQTDRRRRGDAIVRCSISQWIPGCGRRNIWRLAGGLRENGIYVDRAIEGGGSEISVTKTPAGRRFIELSPDTLDMVDHYANNHAADNKYDLVFPIGNGRWQSRRNWQRRGFDVACEEAGLVETVTVDGEDVEQAKYRPYDLRHFFASMLIEKKTNLKKIQALMGHTNIETTLNVYGHLLEESERDKIGVIRAVERNAWENLWRVCGRTDLKPAETLDFSCMGCKGSQVRILSLRPF